MQESCVFQPESPIKSLEFHDFRKILKSRPNICLQDLVEFPVFRKVGNLRIPGNSRGAPGLRKVATFYPGPGEIFPGSGKKLRLFSGPALPENPPEFSDSPLSGKQEIPLNPEGKYLDSISRFSGNHGIPLISLEIRARRKPGISNEIVRIP